MVIFAIVAKTPLIANLLDTGCLGREAFDGGLSGIEIYWIAGGEQDQRE